MTEIAVIADTHLPRGRRELPAKCLRRLGVANLIIHAGDITGEEFLDELLDLGPEVIAVRGNVDAPDVATRLPETASVHVGGVSLGVIHDAGPSRGRLERLRARFPDHDAAIFGHSHLPLHERADGFQIFNPGSPTYRRRAPTATMGIARAKAGRIRFRHIDLG